MKICVGLREYGAIFPERAYRSDRKSRAAIVTGYFVYTGRSHNLFRPRPEEKDGSGRRGSLGARTINQSVISALDRIPGDEVQLIWQSGKYYEESVKAALAGKDYDYVVQMPFITRMDMAYKAADLVISRAGAGSISELCLLGKPALLVPSPNVAEDHQTKNAMALSEKGAALLIPDSEAVPVSSIRRWTLYGTMFCLKKCSSVFFRWRNVIRRPVSPILFLKS